MKKYKKTIGRWGESLAADFLSRRGYAIIERNKRFGRLEIDLIAQSNDITVFIEVKTFSSQKINSTDFFLRHEQISCLKRAMSIYCQQNKINFNNSRLDLVTVDLNRQSRLAKIRHYKNIF
jgi:putative endonuclease